MQHVVFNQKGGVGKSTITCNLAAISAWQGLRTLVIDLDSQGNSTRYLLGADMPADLRERVKKALLDLDASTPEGKEILQLNRATRYIETKPENYKGLEAAGRSAGLI